MLKGLLAGGAVAAATCVAAYAAASPTVSGFAPSHGPAGVRVVLSGAHLAGARGSHAGLRSTVNAAGTKVTTYLPPGLRLGRVTVKVTTMAGSALAAKKFTVDPIP